MATIEGPWSDINKPFGAPYSDITQPKQYWTSDGLGGLEAPHYIFEAATIEELVDFYLANPQYDFSIVLYKGMFIAAAFEGENGEVLLNGKIRRSFRNRLNKIFELEKNDE
jgi:hypothetical protein